MIAARHTCKRNGGVARSSAFGRRSSRTSATLNNQPVTQLTYDQIGNRITCNNTHYRPNACNQYEDLSYDSDGNMTMYDGWALTWNGENRLIRMIKGSAKLEFAYDYMGRRYEKKVYNNNNLTKHQRFIYDGYKLIEIRNALNNDALTHSFVWRKVPQDVPYSMKYGNTTYYYITDANKNVVCLLSSYSIDAYYQYGPWGEIRDIEGTAAYWNPFRFSSEFYDDETGLVYYNYRYYSPTLGRWLSRDPIGEQGGMNLYAMIKNNTINHYDITGLLDLDKTPFYVGFRKLEEKNLLNRIANMLAFEHVDILEEKGGKYRFLRFGFGANKNLSDVLLELKEYKFIQLYISKSGIIRWGSAKKKKCECTTIDDIRACILDAPSPLSKESVALGTNCHSDIEYVLAGCCLFGFNSLNLFSTPYDYEGDEEKILHCFKQKIWQIPYANMSADDIYITCKRDVMKGFYD